MSLGNPFSREKKTKHTVFLEVESKIDCPKSVYLSAGVFDTHFSLSGKSLSIAIPNKLGW